MSSFSKLPTETQEMIRCRQAEAKRKRLQTKLEQKGSSSANSSDSSSRAIHISTSTSCGDAMQSAPPTLGDQFPDTVSDTQYFAAASGGCFCDPRIPATLSGVDNLLKILMLPANALLRTCNYFKFPGSAEQQWDPTLLAKLAYEGFFTITHKTRGSAGAAVEPLPELQPMYGVVLWPHFDQSNDNKTQLRLLSRMVRGQPHRRFALRVNRDPRATWSALDAYHRKNHGSNWLTSKYLDQSLATPATVNFKLHCIELFETAQDGTETLLAGEIGFSVGKVYTSLSGWTQQRTRERPGKTQLVLLGLWLKKRGYEVWSLGHCYSPQMEYKRQLGHRIWPREDFRALLKLHRGPFELNPELKDCEVGGFKRLADGDSACAEELLSAVHAASDTNC